MDATRWRNYKVKKMRRKRRCSHFLIVNVFFYFNVLHRKYKATKKIQGHLSKRSQIDFKQCLYSSNAKQESH
jgi:hypothetical protein